jgi:hypothetical protein
MCGVPTPDIDSLGNHCALARESCTGDATWEPLEQFKEDFLRFLGSRTSCFARREGGRSVVDSFGKWYTRRKKATTATKPIRC